ncbi:GntR family transcriptional regulator [Promicromonospora sp. Populi]|uniref:GntR family transcriptional regulator n=1 Tax=Promicromonospora sp. Populi TaxID=3239420 RepID=UPI0034E1A0E6
MSKSTEIVRVLAEELQSVPPGTRVASEADVGQRFGVGRAAARAALGELERRMLVSRIQGVGTFTRRRVDYLVAPGKAPSWSRTIREAGATPRTVVLACDEVPLPSGVAAELGTGPGEPGFRLVRRSFIDDMPAAWGVEWLTVALVPELPTALRHEESLDAILRAVARVRPERAWTRSSMESAPDDASAGLGCRPGDPAWLIVSLARDGADGRPVLFTERWVRSDAVRVIVELGAHGTTAARGATPGGPVSSRPT